MTRLLVAGLLVLLGVWASAALALGGTGAEGPHWARLVWVLLGVVGIVLAWRSVGPSVALAVGVVGAAAVGLWLRAIPARTDRAWAEDLTRAAHAKVEGPRVTVYDARDFRYRSTDTWEARWFDGTYDVRELTGAWFVVEPFTDGLGAAHTMVSFGFADGRYLTFSVEVRRERGERFSVLGGMFRRFEVIYVVGDERDLVQLRSNHRKDVVYLYPVRASRERITAFFLDMVERMNALHARPEFYNTLTNNCTTNLVRHLERVAGIDVPYDHRTLLPAYVDALAQQLELIDTDAPLEVVRERYRINARALEAADAEDFSARIRATR